MFTGCANRFPKRNYAAARHQTIVENDATVAMARDRVTSDNKDGIFHKDDYQTVW